MAESLERSEPILLFIRMNPPWIFIDEIRRFVESFCACACPGKDREAQLALAVHELVQNAIADSEGNVADVELSLAVDPARDRVSVTVSNACTAARAEDLRARLAAMNAEPDPLKHYLRLMAETPPTTRGGLGLARVRCEAELDIEAFHDGRRVTVIAAGKLVGQLQSPAITRGIHA